MRPSFHRCQTSPIGGFTLFEVTISLVLVTFSVVSVLMLLPSGIRAQQLSRYQVLASARAMEMIDQFSSSANTNLKMEREGVNPWDSYVSYRAYSPDLETRIGTYRFGLFPLPTTIAKRLESDGDEIRSILDRGGYLYYTQPMATTGFNPVGMRDQMPLPNESQKLLCAITGYAQQNAMTANSWKDWPYYATYPSPPMHGIHKYGGTPSKNFTDGDGIQNTDYYFYEKQWDPTWGEWFLNWEDSLPADNGEMGLVFRGIIRNTTTLPLTSAWVDSVDVDGVTASGRLLHKCSGYFAYGDLGGWILDRQVDKDADGNPKFPGYWRQLNPDGLKRLNNRSDNMGQPEFLPGTMKPNPVYTKSDGSLTTMTELSRESALAYFGLAYWYAKRKGVSDAILNGTVLLDDANLLSKSTLFQATATHNPALAVNAARFLAHAAMCVTAHFRKPLPALPPANGQPEPDETITLAGEFTVRDPRNKKAPQGPTFTMPMAFNKALAHTYYDNAMKLVMRYAASHPYDFGAPRPLNRAIMMDFPLIQYDPFGGLVTADTSGFPSYNYGSIPTESAANHSGAVSGSNQWRMISAQPITNLGRSFSYPAINLSAKRDAITSTGTGSHFTLTRPFDAADRCRQIVFFSVDWQAYEDFETAPSAPVDASRYPRLAPHNRKSQLTQLLDGEFADRFAYGMRNPEKTIVYAEDTANKPTGDDVVITGIDNMWPMWAWPDYKTGGRQVFSGRYGADRNFNGTKTDKSGTSVLKLYGKLDRGPVPASTRMRAVTVARFNYYDPRLPLVTR